MGLIQKLIASVCNRCQIEHTNVESIFTKYGMCLVNMYMYNQQEYLVIMSKNFFDLKTPILYIHSDTHQCNPLSGLCSCNNQVDVAIAPIIKDGGILIYCSIDSTGIDNMLRKINIEKKELPSEVLKGTNLKSALKGYRGEFLTIDFILKNLSLSNVELVTNNPSIIYIVEQLGITITELVPSISFVYGNAQSSSANETIEAAKAISFTYNDN